MNSIYVFHNRVALAMFRGLKQGDELTLAHRVEIDKPFASEPHMLRVIFSWFNHGSGTTLPDYYARSLTTGDVITYVSGGERTSFSVATGGWIKLPKAVEHIGPYGYYRSREGGFGAGPNPEARA